MNEFWQFLKNLWATVKANPIVVGVYTAMGTAIYAQLQSYVTTGTFNESPAYWEKTFAAAVLATVANLYHLSVTPQK